MSLGRVGRWELRSELGRGGMGVVYRARDPRLGREVAVKLLLDGGEAGPEERARFLREAHATAALSHPGIIAVHEVGDHAGQPFLVMPLLAGETLEARTKRAPPTPRAAAAVVAELARAVAHAHERGIVHRDIKPQNVMLVPDGGGERAVLMDLGLARGKPVGDRLTKTGQVLGTLEYMAPEQADAAEPVGPPADVYALGAVLYRLLCGRPPFTGSQIELVKKVLFDEPDRPSTIAAGRVERDLEAICLRALEKEPGDRYGSAAQLADDLDRFGRGEPVRAKPPTGMTRWWRRVPRRWRRPAATLGIGSIVVGLLAGVSAGILGLPTVGRERLPATELPELRRLAFEGLEGLELARARLAELDPDHLHPDDAIELSLLETVVSGLGRIDDRTRDPSLEARPWSGHRTDLIRFLIATRKTSALRRILALPAALEEPASIDAVLEAVRAGSVRATAELTGLLDAALVDALSDPPSAGAASASRATLALHRIVEMEREPKDAASLADTIATARELVDRIRQADPARIAAPEHIAARARELVEELQETHDPPGSGECADLFEAAERRPYATADFLAVARRVAVIARLVEAVTLAYPAERWVDLRDTVLHGVRTTSGHKCIPIFWINLELMMALQRRGEISAWPPEPSLLEDWQKSLTAVVDGGLLLLAETAGDRDAATLALVLDALLARSSVEFRVRLPENGVPWPGDVVDVFERLLDASRTDRDETPGWVSIWLADRLGGILDLPDGPEGPKPTNASDLDALAGASDDHHSFAKAFDTELVEAEVWYRRTIRDQLRATEAWRSLLHQVGGGDEDALLDALHRAGVDRERREPEDWRRVDSFEWSLRRHLASTPRAPIDDLFREGMARVDRSLARMMDVSTRNRLLPTLQRALDVGALDPVLRRRAGIRLAALVAQEVRLEDARALLDATRVEELDAADLSTRASVWELLDEPTRAAEDRVKAAALAD